MTKYDVFEYLSLWTYCCSYIISAGSRSVLVMLPLCRLAARNNLSALCFVCGQCEWLSVPTSSSASVGDSGMPCPQSLHHMGPTDSRSCNIYETVIIL